MTSQQVMQRRHHYALAYANPDYNDFDVISDTGVHRFCVPHTIAIGQQFNVYGPGCTKRGALWLGSVDASINKFLDSLDPAQSISTCTVYAVSCTASQANQTNWYLCEEAAQCAFTRSKNRFTGIDMQLTLFKIPASVNLSNAAITDLVNLAMRDKAYELIKEVRLENPKE